MRMVHLVLEDGRGFWRPTAAMSGIYYLIADWVDDSNGKFKRWLQEMSKRTVPDMDLDIRGLPEECRAEFHRAARRACDRLLLQIQAGQLPAGAADSLRTLVRMKESIDRGEPPLSLSDDTQVQPFHGFVCNLDETWHR
jgi:hypothetical protein